MRVTAAAALVLGLLETNVFAVAEHTVKLFPDSMRIDGVLDEPAWQGSDSILLVRNNAPTGGTPSVVTKVKVGWNKTRLFIAYVAYTKNVKATYTKHDQNLYEEDAVEMFVDPDGDGKNYFEFEWNCLNTSYDELFHSAGTGESLAYTAKGMLNAVKVQGTANKASDTDTSFTVEISLPWSDIQPWSKQALPPKNGDMLSINFYRIDNPVNGTQELLAWSPTGAANFHLPDKFGHLIFSDSAVTGILAVGEPARFPLSAPGKTASPRLFIDPAGRMIGNRSAGEKFPWPISPR